VIPREDENSMVGSRWIYKIKYGVDGIIENFKARFLAKGFSEKEGVYYDETFSPLFRYTSIRDMISLVEEIGWKIHHMDVNMVFLNGVIEEEVCIK
jgi:hypothetical protein